MDARHLGQTLQGQPLGMMQVDQLGQRFGMAYAPLPPRGARARMRTCLRRSVQPVERDAPDAQPHLVGDQPPAHLRRLPPIGGPARGRGAVSRVRPQIREEHALHDGLLDLAVDGECKEIDQREIDADELRAFFDRDGAVRNRRPEEHQPSRLDTLPPPVEQVGHLAVEQQVDLDMVVPMGRAHSVGNVALDLELAEGKSGLEGCVVRGTGFRHVTIPAGDGADSGSSRALSGRNSGLGE